MREYRIIGIYGDFCKTQNLGQDLHCLCIPLARKFVLLLPKTLVTSNFNIPGIVENKLYEYVKNHIYDKNRLH